MRRSSLEVVVDNIIKEGNSDPSGRCPDGIITTENGIIIGNRYRFIRTYSNVPYQEAVNNTEYAKTVTRVLEDILNNANEEIVIPTLKHLKANTEALRSSESHTKGSRVLYNANGCVVNVKYLIDALRALKDIRGDVVINTWKNEKYGYINPIVVSKISNVLQKPMDCVILPVVNRGVKPLAVGSYRIITKHGQIRDYDCLTLEGDR